MKTAHLNQTQEKASTYRSQLIADLPVKEQQITAGGISTAYLEGGEGTPMILLHGPGESSAWWLRVIPLLVKKFKVIMPDLPGHGSSGSAGKKLDKTITLDWLDDFIDQTCTQKPALVGHVLGGAIAARYAIEHPNKLKQIILVDSLGLSFFFPAPLFAFELFRFMFNPNEKSYLRFLPHCLYDLNKLSQDMGQKWQPFLDYNIGNVQNPKKKAAIQELMGVFTSKIPTERLKQLDIPVALIWGRHDKANKLKVAIKASEKYGWPLHVIEETRDDPKLEKPADFVRAVQSSIDQPVLEK